MQNPFNLSDEAEKELYHLYDVHVTPLVKNSVGTIDMGANDFSNNLLDALRHAYVSGVFTMAYSEKTADLFGRLNEVIPMFSKGIQSKDINMDLWNNAVGRKYGKKAKSKKDLFKLLLEAQKKGELIQDSNDGREYKGSGAVTENTKGQVLVIKESESGENLIFYDSDRKEVMSKEYFVTQIKKGRYSKYETRNIKGIETPVSKKDRFNVNNLG